jgi:hypothetical protein
MTATASRVPRQVHYRLSSAQKVVLNSPARFRVLVAGRRFGKSYLACLILIRDAWSAPNRTCWYVAPTYRQGKQILWTLLKRLVPHEYVNTTNETDLSMVLINGSTIAIRGADNPASLRGVGLDFAALDEFAFMASDIWYEAIRPALADRQGSALFITTPNGMGWDYDLYMLGREGRDGFASWTFTTLEGGNVLASEIEAARSSMDPRLFRQEFEASFETLQGRVYANFERAQFPAGNVDASIVDTGGEILIGQDFNVNPMGTIIAVRAGDECHVLDALEVPTSNTEEVAAEIRRRYPDRRIIVCPDPSGKARKTSAVAGVTDFTILQRHGFTVDAPLAAPAVVDRVNAVQAMLRDANGRRRLKVHPRATALIRALDGLTYKDGTSIPDKNSGLDHLCFAGDTLVETPSGLTPIADLPWQGSVRGPLGEFVPYVAACRTGRGVQTVRIEFASGDVVECTPSHRFLTNAGWVRAVDLLRDGGYIEVCDIESLAPHFKSGTAFDTHSAESISSERECAFTASYLPLSMDRSRAECTSTTLTGTGRITIRQTSPSSPRAIITGDTCESRRDARSLPPAFAAPSTPRSSGTEAKQGEHGIGSTMSATVLRCTSSTMPCASSAGESIKLRDVVPLLSAERIAKLLGDGTKSSTTRRALARIAAQPSRVIDICKLPIAPDGVAPSHGRVVSVTRASSRDVYDLCVPGVGAFALASGLVVSNCDALGYLMWQRFNLLVPVAAWGSSTWKR